MEKIRLQKYFTDCGVLSRRAAEAEIAAGHVTVNGHPARVGDKVLPGTDHVVWNGRGVVWHQNEKKTVVALNKPRGYVCTAKDEKGRKQVTELVADAGIRLYPIGRLDMASEGLLLMTDDGELANLLMHPRHHVEKVYRVSVRGKVDDGVLALLRSPMEIDGTKIQPVLVDPLEQNEESALLEMTLFEGRNRQIRKMCEIARLEVARLRRVRIGCVSVNGIAPGKWRVLRDDEVAALRRAARASDDEE